jgi:hypothetical protein
MSSRGSSRRRFLTTALTAAATPWPQRVRAGRALRVGPGGDVATLAEAAKVARDGDTVELPAGTYRGETAVWTQGGVTIRGVGGMARLEAAGANAEGKGIFVVRSDGIAVENVAFIGARVRDGNGAGIRLERGRLDIRDCLFEDNENGILTGNDATSELRVTSSTFLRNGSPDGRAHTVYVGLIASAEFSGCYMGQGRVGHLLKCRARRSSLRYCRLSTEDGTASYELEFPSGGQATVVGNLIQQGPASQNYTIVAFGQEGYRWPDNRLLLGFNTIVNDRPQGGVFITAAAGDATVESAFNLFVGEGAFEMRGAFNRTGDAKGARGDFGDVAKLDYRLRPTSRLVGSAGLAAQIPAAVPLPEREYRHIAGSAPIERASGLSPVSPGAFQTLADVGGARK